MENIPNAVCLRTTNAIQSNQLNPIDKAPSRFFLQYNNNISPQDVQVNDFFVGPSNFIPYI